MSLSLELTDDQAIELAGLLEAALSDLSYEIADTDNFDFRTGLKQRRKHLAAIAAMLASATQD